MYANLFAKAWHSPLSPPPPDSYLELEGIQYQHLRKPLYIVQNILIEAIQSLSYTCVYNALKKTPHYYF